MPTLSPPVIDVMSPNAYGHILASGSLSKKILPEGWRISPYEILAYHGTLTLTDREGGEAILRRSQQVRFLQEGVSAILDHFWGDGIPLSDYRHTGGQLVDSFKDGNRHHLAVELARPMHRGET